MFDTLDDKSPARIPPPAPPPKRWMRSREYRIARWINIGVLAALAAASYYNRRYPDSHIDGELLLLFLIFAGLFVVFEWSAYQDRKSGPIDLGL